MFRSARRDLLRRWPQLGLPILEYFHYLYLCTSRTSGTTTVLQLDKFLNFTRGIPLVGTTSTLAYILRLVNLATTVSSDGERIQHSNVVRNSSERRHGSFWNFRFCPFPYKVACFPNFRSQPLWGLPRTDTVVPTYFPFPRLYSLRLGIPAHSREMPQPDGRLFQS